jgi:hypothetical protein
MFVLKIFPKPIRSEIQRGSLRIDIRNFTPGLYLYKVYLQTGEQSTGKFLVNR